VTCWTVTTCWPRAFPALWCLAFLRRQANATTLGRMRQ
jgi:hypothetical protein